METSSLFTREDLSDMGFSQYKVLIIRLAITLDVGDPTVALCLSKDELLSTKAMFWVDILELTQTAS